MICFIVQQKTSFAIIFLFLAVNLKLLILKREPQWKWWRHQNDEIFWLFLKVLQILMAFHFNLMHDQVHWNRFHIEEIIFPFSNFFQCIAGFCTCRIVTEKFLWFQRPHYRLVPYIYQTGINTKLGIKCWKLQITF